jgi:hypothetical protein
MFRINLERERKSKNGFLVGRVRRAPVLVCVLYSFVFRKRRKMTLNGREAGVIRSGSRRIRRGPNQRNAAYNGLPYETSREDRWDGVDSWWNRGRLYRLLKTPKVSHPRSEDNFCTKQGENLGLQFKFHMYT